MSRGGSRGGAAGGSSDPLIPPDGNLNVTGDLTTSGDITTGDDLFISNGGVINFNAGDVTITHASNLLTLAGGTLTTSGTGGITYAPGSDADCDIITTTVTGTPKIYWDESEDRFRSTHGMNFDGLLNLYAAADPIILSRAGSDPDTVLSLRRWATDHTVFTIFAPSPVFWPSLEATLSLTRYRQDIAANETNSQFLDFYNIGSAGSAAALRGSYGFRIQKRGSGEYAPFRFEYSADGSVAAQTGGYDPDLAAAGRGAGQSFWHFNCGLEPAALTGAGARAWCEIGSHNITTNSTLGLDAALRIINRTVPTVGVPTQYSPLLEISGAAWNSVNSDVEWHTWGWQVKATTAAGATSGPLSLAVSVDGAAYADVFTVYADGGMNLGGWLTLVGGGTVTTSANGDLGLVSGSGLISCSSGGTVFAGNVNGLDLNPGSDVDSDLVTVGVTGAPKFMWDESEDNFTANKPLNISATSGTAGRYGIGFGASAGIGIDGDNGVLSFYESSTKGAYVDSNGAKGRASQGAAYPGVSFIGDTDTGIFHDSADVGGFTSGGIAAMTFTEVSSHVVQVTETHGGLTASTTQTQVGGLALLSSFNVITTVANANDTVTLPAAAAGKHCVVINKAAANILKIYPASGDDLGTGVDTSTTLVAGLTTHYFAIDATTWVAI